MDNRSHPLESLRLLVVEDEALITEEIRERLHRLGAEVVDVVDSGEAAEESARTYRPDLVLMDIRLKGALTGIEAADNIRRTFGIPIVFLTAHSDWETVVRARRSDPFGYVLKPFDEGELVATLQVAVHRNGLERRLHESRRRYSATLASIGEGVISTDPGGKVSYMNPAAESLTGWNLREASGRSIDEIVPMELEVGAPFEHPVLQALRRVEKIEFSDPVLLRTRTGDPVPVDVTSSPILASDIDPAALGAVISFRDCRPRRAAEETIRTTEEQLREAQRLEIIGRLAGGVAHDFNNALTVINGRSQLALSKLGTDDPMREMFLDILNAGERAAKLTSQLLAFSGRQVIKPESLDLNALAMRLEPTIRHMIGDDIDLRLALGPGMTTAFVDPQQMEQVLLNLAFNARDAMPEGGTLTIETRFEPNSKAAISKAGDSVLVVSDDGVGMDAETMGKVFEPFFTTKEVGEGSGLGLAVVQGIVDQSAGTIHVASSPGMGTSVTIRLPASSLQPDVVVWAGQPRLNPALHGSECILVVEDQPEVRKYTAEVLEIYGYRTVQVANAEQALDVFDAGDEHIDFVLSDVVMPGTSGRELARQVRQLRPDLGIVLMSGYPRDASGQDPGDFPFIQKPFRPEELVRKIRSVMTPPSDEPGRGR
jgi:hypothetical protein